MLNSNHSVKNIMNAIVPISRFNKGEANKIFDEVSKNGFKIVIKNNAPACVLLEPHRYEALIEALEDYELYFEAVKRSETLKPDNLTSHENLMKKHNITQNDLDSIEDVEIE